MLPPTRELGGRVTDLPQLLRHCRQCGHLSNNFLGFALCKIP
jgi:hypothetical protein